MKINLYGALWADNFGDILLAQMFLRNLDPANNEIKFPFVSKFICQRIGVERSNLLDFARADETIFIGGGYLSEPPHNLLKWSLSRYKKIFIFADLARVFGNGYSIVGVGAGPINNPISKFFIRRFCNNARLLIVRDDESKETLQKIGVINKIEVRSDMVFNLETKDVILNEKKIGLHLTSKLKEINEYVIDYFENKGYEVHLIVDNPPELGHVLKSNPRIELMCQGRYISYEGDTGEFINKLNEMNFIFTSKLHVGIISSILNKKICSIPYHDKVKRLYAELNRPDVCLFNEDRVYNQASVVAHIEHCLNSDVVQIPVSMKRKAALLIDDLNGIIVR